MTNNESYEKFFISKILVQLSAMRNIIAEMDETQERVQKLKSIIRLTERDIAYLENSDDPQGCYYGRFYENFKMKDVKALLVDDETKSNDAIINTLENHNVKLDVAESIEQAIEKYEEQEYDMVLIAYDMSIMKVTNEIRKMGDRGVNQIIIGLTKNLEEKNRRLQKELNKWGVEITLYKPVQEFLIEAVLQREFSDRVLCPS